MGVFQGIEPIKDDLGVLLAVGMAEQHEIAACLIHLLSFIETVHEADGDIDDLIWLVKDHLYKATMHCHDNRDVYFNEVAAKTRARLVEVFDDQPPMTGSDH